MTDSFHSLGPAQDMTDADLAGARLRDTNYEGATFDNADLSDADLSGSNLANASLKDVDLSGLTFSR